MAGITYYTYNRDSTKDIIEDTTKHISQLSDGTNTYAIKDAEARSELSNKQNTLISGTNIKTINGNSLLGSGNIEVGGSSYTAGTGIDITNNVVSVDNTVALKSEIPAVDQTYSSNSTSTNALSHKAVADSKFIQNTASSNLSTTVGGIATTSLVALNVGNGSSVSANYGTAVGVSAAVIVLAEYGVALGQGAVAGKTHAIQLGHGTNSEANSFYVGLSDSDNYKLLSSDGTIPNTRLNVMTGADGTNAGTKGAVPAPTATDNTKFLRGDGTWATVSGGGSDVEEYSVAEIEALWNGESE